MLDNYELLDRYRRESGRVLMTGTQALVRIALMQRTVDVAAGLNTAGFISGYRGSPLGMVDQELWRARRFLEESNIEFLPAVNEDLAATAVLGSQQVETDPAPPLTVNSAPGASLTARTCHIGRALRGEYIHEAPRLAPQISHEARRRSLYRPQIRLRK